MKRIIVIVGILILFENVFTCSSKSGNKTKDADCCAKSNPPKWCLSPPSSGGGGGGGAAGGRSGPRGMSSPSRGFGGFGPQAYYCPWHQYCCRRCWYYCWGNWSCYLRCIRRCAWCFNMMMGGFPYRK